MHFYLVKCTARFVAKSENVSDSRQWPLASLCAPVFASLRARKISAECGRISWQSFTSSSRVDANERSSLESLTRYTRKFLVHFRVSRARKSTIRKLCEIVANKLATRKIRVCNCIENLPPRYCGIEIVARVSHLEVEKSGRRHMHLMQAIIFSSSDTRLHCR